MADPVTREADPTGGNPLRDPLRARRWGEWIVLVTVLLSFAGYVGFSLHSSHKATEAEELAKLVHQADVVTRNLAPRLQSTAVALDAIRDELPEHLSQKDGFSLVSQQMRTMTAAVAGLRTFVLINADGVAVASNRPELIGVDFHEGERYRAISSRPDANMLYMSPPFLSSLGNWVLSLGRAIVDDQGKFGGYVLAIIDPDYWNLLLDSTRNGPDVTAAIVHGDGKLIYRVPDPNGAVGLDLARNPDSGFSQHVLSGKDRTSRTAIVASTGREALFALQTIRPVAGPADGFLVASFSRETAAVFAPWRKALIEQVALLAGIALVTSLGLLVYQRRRETITKLRASREEDRRREEEAGRRTAALREAEERSRATLTSMAEGVVMQDASGKIVQCNAAAERILGLTREQMEGLTSVDHRWRSIHEDGSPFPGEDHPAMVALRTGDAVSDVVMGVHKPDGTLTWISINAEPVPAAPGETHHAVVTTFADVTVLRGATAALQDRGKRLRAYFDSPAVGVAITSQETGFVEVNDQFCAMLGYSREELLRLNWTALTHPDDVRADISEFNRVLAGDIDTYSMDKRYVRKDGSVVWTLLSVSCVRRPDRTVETFVAIVKEIGERKLAEASLRESDDRLRVAMEGGNVGLWDWDLSTNRVHFSPTWKRQVGYEDHEITDDFVEWESRVHPDDLVAATARVREFLRAPYPGFENEFRFRHKDGSYRSILARASVMLDEAGRPTRMLGSHIDLTERKEVEERLRESEQRFRDIAASAGEYIFEMNALGVITYMSEVVELVLGYRPEEVVGKSSLLLMGPEEQARSAAFLEERVSRGEGFAHFQQEARHRTGRSVWLDVSVVVVKAADGSVCGYRGAALDVTKQHVAEKERAALRAQLAESQRLESIGRLAGGIAHDFNNLLTAILSFGSEALEEAKRGKVPEPEVLDEVMAAAKRAADLTRQLLAFARRQTIAPVILDLNEHISATQSLLKRVIGEDVRMVERLHADLWTVRCDPGLLGQVMLNLAVNARDAMPGGGTLTVSTRNVTVSPGDAVPDPAMAPGDYVRLLVEDTGTGMMPEVMAHLFEPFFTTKEPGRGTGLGLSTVFGIVKQSGAHIGVRSTPGKGTAFDIFFPRQDGEPVSPVLPPTRVEGGDETVLVVEDDPSVRAATVRALEAGGYRVLVASGADEALELAGAEPGRVHVLLTDVVMPGRGGPEVARLLIEKRPDIRVLYMSGYGHDAIGHRGVLDAGTNIIGKPFTPDALRARVKEVIGTTTPPPKA